MDWFYASCYKLPSYIINKYFKFLCQTPKNINTLTQQSHCYFIIILHNFYTNIQMLPAVNEVTNNNNYTHNISTVIIFPEWINSFQMPAGSRVKRYDKYCEPITEWLSYHSSRMKL
jgi:hypothetical protein